MKLIMLVTIFFVHMTANSDLRIVDDVQRCPTGSLVFIGRIPDKIDIPCEARVCFVFKNDHDKEMARKAWPERPSTTAERISE